MTELSLSVFLHKVKTLIGLINLFDYGFGNVLYSEPLRREITSLWANRSMIWHSVVAFRPAGFATYRSSTGVHVGPESGYDFFSTTDLRIAQDDSEWIQIRCAAPIVRCAYCFEALDTDENPKFEALQDAVLVGSSKARSLFEELWSECSWVECRYVLPESPHGPECSIEHSAYKAYKKIRFHLNQEDYACLAKSGITPKSVRCESARMVKDYELSQKTRDAKLRKIRRKSITIKSTQFLATQSKLLELCKP